MIEPDEKISLCVRTEDRVRFKNIVALAPFDPAAGLGARPFGEAVVPDLSAGRGADSSAICSDLGSSVTGGIVSSA